MKFPGIAILVLLLTPAWASPQQTTENNVDVGALLSDSKKPCDEDKKKAEAEAKKNEQALQNLLGNTPADKKPAEQAPKSLGAVQGMGNCK